MKRMTIRWSQNRERREGIAEWVKRGCWGSNAVAPARIIMKIGSIWDFGMLTIERAWLPHNSFWRFDEHEFQNASERLVELSFIATFGARQSQDETTRPSPDSR